MGDICHRATKAGRARGDTWFFILLAHPQPIFRMNISKKERGKEVTQGSAVISNRPFPELLCNYSSILLLSSNISFRNNSSKSSWSTCYMPDLILLHRCLRISSAQLHCSQSACHPNSQMNCELCFGGKGVSMILSCNTVCNPSPWNIHFFSQPLASR